jgi:excisionase family DNA binding protein
MSFPSPEPINLPQPLPEVEVPPLLPVEEEEEERREVHVELTSEQLEKLIDAIVPEVMSADQLARYLQKGRGWVCLMARKGIIPAYKMGNSWRFTRKTVDAWLLRQVSASLAGKSGGDSNK